ncbi:MAG: hypothetical protein ACREIB_13225, partial [Pseudomonadota bacterium]
DTLHSPRVPRVLPGAMGSIVGYHLSGLALMAGHVARTVPGAYVKVFHVLFDHGEAPLCAH